MRLLIHTENSRYLIDTREQTWERQHKTAGSGKIRTESGTYRFMKQPTVGEPLYMVCPPINPPHPRLIITSHITKLEQVL